MTRLAVVADAHCDDFGSRIDAETGLNARWTDSVDMLRWIARDALARDADALIVAGDLSESRHPAPWRVAQIGEAIAEFDGPVILARGNHDGLRADRSIVDVLAAGRSWWQGFSRPGVTVVGDTAIAVLPYLDRHHLRAQAGYESLPDADVFRVLGEAFVAVAAGLYVQAHGMETGGTVLVVHQALSGGLMSDAQSAFLGDLSLVVDTRALSAIGYDAVLAGHFHRHQVLSTKPLVTYAGAPTRTDFGEEHQTKGYLIVDVQRGSADMQFVETPARRFVTLRGDASVAEMLDGADVAGAVVRVVDLRPELDAAKIRGLIEDLGAFEVASITKSRIDQESSAAALPETLTAEQALAEYFDADPDRETLLERGRELVAAAR